MWVRGVFWVLIVGLFTVSECAIVDDLVASFDNPRNLSVQNSWRRQCDYNTDASDIHLSTEQIIRKNGLPVEIHHVMTPDGFILEFHRITNQGKPIVMLFHGMVMSSNVFFLHCDGRSLPLKLARANYDVWLFNARGNAYSYRHINLTTSDPEYWSYGVDEIIKYDVPTGIDYALKVTGQDTVNFYGWSLGSAVIMGLLSSRPEYNEKVNIIFSVGTVAYVGNTKAPLFRLLGFINQLYDNFFTLVANGAFLPKFLYPILQTVMPIICTPEAKLNTIGICSLTFFLMGGPSPNQINPPFYPMYWRHFPSTASVKMINQWFQWIHLRSFTFYDFGKRLNMKKYGHPRPPEYDISKVTARFVNFWSENDWISTPKDVHRTIQRLPNVIYNIRMSDPKWNHFDFNNGKDADIHVYNPIIEILNKYT